MLHLYYSFILGPSYARVFFFARGPGPPRLYARADLARGDGVLLDHLLHQVDLGRLNVDNAALAFEKTLELLREYVSLEVERWCVLQCARDRF